MKMAAFNGNAGIAERTLGKRTVFYLKNEAMVGRIAKHRIQTLSSILGVSSQAKINLDKCKDGEDRFKAMGDVLDLWCSKSTMKAIDNMKLSNALEQARLVYHAQAIREMNQDMGSSHSASLIKPPVGYNSNGKTQASSANGHLTHPGKGRRPPPPSRQSLGTPYYNPQSSNSNSLNDRRSSSSLTITERQSDCGTEEGSDSSSLAFQQSGFTRKQQLEELDFDEIEEQVDDEVLTNFQANISPAKSKKNTGSKSPIKKRQKPVYSYDGKVKKPKELAAKTPTGGYEGLTSSEKQNGHVNNGRENPESPTKSPSRRIPKYIATSMGKSNLAHKPKSTFDLLIDEEEDDAILSKDMDPPGRNDGSQYNIPKSTQKTRLPNIGSPTKSKLKSGGIQNKEEKSFSNQARTKTTFGSPKKQNVNKNGKNATTDMNDDNIDLVGDNGYASSSPSKSRFPLNKDKKKTFNSSQNNDHIQDSSTPVRSTRGRSRSQPPVSPAKKKAETVKASLTENEDVQPPTSSPKKRKGEASGSKYSSSDEKSANSRKIKAWEAERERRRYYYSKYGTWRELQKLSKANLKKMPEEEDTLQQDIEAALESVDYIDAKEKPTYASALFTKIRSEKYLNSLCSREKDYLHFAVHIFSSFGTDIHAVTRTQVLVWYTLERLRRFWILAEEPLPSAEDIIKDPETMEFMRNVSKLCYNVSNTEQIAVTGLIEHDKRKRTKIYIVFKQFGGMKILKKQLETYGIVKVKETGNFIEVRFKESLFVDFLGALHTHLEGEELNDFSKTKLLTSLPFLCGLSSNDKTSGQKIVIQLIHGISGLPPNRNPDFYVRYLNNMWLESQQTFLDCVYDARMRNINTYPPPGDKQIVLALSKLYLYHVITLAFYLDNIDKTRVQLEGLMMQECSIDDTCLRTIGKNLWTIKKVQITGNYFTFKGIHDITKQLKSSEHLRIRSLDLSDSNIDDEALAKLSPILPYLEELCLSDNFLTWYGIRKITQPHKKTKRLKRLEMSRCNLNEHAFYELIPLILRTEHVILESNEFSPLELKIFARQVRECQNFKLNTFVLNNCKLDDICMFEISKFITRIPHTHLQNNNFSEEGMAHLGKYCRKYEMGSMKSVNLRGCKLNAKALGEISDIIPLLENITLSNNNFSDPEGAKQLSQSLDVAEEIKIKFIDLRHCRLVESVKKLLNDVCRKNKIDVKMW